MSAPSEAEATIAVDAAARKAWDLQREALRDQGYATPEFDALAPAEKLRVREQVLPFVWAALEALERPDLARVRALVSDWQANAGSRALGDPTAATWERCAHQLLCALDGIDE